MEYLRKYTDKISKKSRIEISKKKIKKASNSPIRVNFKMLEPIISVLGVENQMLILT